MSGLGRVAARWWQVGSILTLLALPGSLAAQAATPIEAAPTSRPRIGLVLSGGGARGAAHVGVLKVLEELHVPIDCIAGTSMGAIVGAAYASGMTVREMEQAIGGINSGVLFREQPPRQDQLLRRKQEDLSNLIGPEFGLSKEGLSLPKGAVSGVALEAVLRTLSSRQRGMRNFDELPIPYRAVATDIETGQMIVLGRGELASAMRASMSVPGAIAPAEIEGRMLIDGGLVRNLPVDIARGMCADIVIAVNLGTTLLRRDQITSIVGVSAQMLNILTEQNVQASLASLKPTDILISPALGDFSAGDFDNLPRTIPIGETAAWNVAEKLRALSLPPDQYAEVYRKRTGEVIHSTLPIAAIRFEGLRRSNPEVLAGMMNTEVGRQIDQAVLDADLRRIYGRGDFERVEYRVIDEDGKRTLVVRPIEKLVGPTYLRFGMTLSTDFSGDAFFNLLAMSRTTWINSLGAEWRNEAQLGRLTRFGSEFFQPLNAAQSFFIAPRVEFQQRLFDLFSDGARLARFAVREARAGIDVGAQVTKYGEVRLGLMRGVLDYDLETGPASLTPSRLAFNKGGWLARARFDQLDSVNFPRSGFGASLNVLGARKSLGSSDSYTRWDLDWLGAVSLDRHTFQAAMRAGGRLGDRPIPGYDPFQLGGFLQQSGFKTGQLLGDKISFGRVLYQYRVVDTPLLDGAYVGMSLETGKIGGIDIPGQPVGWMKSLALFVAFDSPIGPLYLGVGRTSSGETNAYLFLGRP